MAVRLDDRLGTVVPTAVPARFPRRVEARTRDGRRTLAKHRGGPKSATGKWPAPIVLSRFARAALAYAFRAGDPAEWRPAAGPPANQPIWA